MHAMLLPMLLQNSALMLSWVGKFLVSNPAYSFLSSASPFALNPASISYSSVTSLLSTGSSQIMPFLASLPGQLGSVITAVGGPWVALAIVTTAALTSTAVYLYVHRDQEDPLSREQTFKAALWAFASGVSALLIVFAGINLYQYLNPDQAINPTEPMAAADPLAKAKFDLEKEKHNLEKDKLAYAKEKSEGDIGKKVTDFALAPSIGTAAIGALAIAKQSPETAMKVLAAGGGMAKSFASGTAGTASNLAAEHPEAAAALAVGTTALVLGYVYRDKIKDSIYGSYEERVGICIEILKELDKTKPYKPGSMARLAKGMGIEMDLNASDINQMLGQKLIDNYKGMNGDPVDLFLQEVTTKLTHSLQQHHKDKTLPKELNPLEIYQGKVYPTTRLENKIENAASAVASIPGRVVGEIVAVPMGIVGGIAVDVAAGIRASRIPKSVDVKRFVDTHGSTDIAQAYVTAAPEIQQTESKEFYRE